MSQLHPIVCSVCGGRGLVEAGGQQGPASWVVLVIALILCVLGLGEVCASVYIISHPPPPQDQQSQPDDRTEPAPDQTSVLR
jgi:hypothetical protein